MTAQTNPSDSNEHPLPPEHSHLDERRRSTRFVREPDTDYASIVGPSPLVGWVEVADESLGGMGLVVDDRAPYFIGQIIELTYAGTFYRAQVRHITRRNDGRFVLGVLCSA